MNTFFFGEIEVEDSKNVSKFSQVSYITYGEKSQGHREQEAQVLERKDEKFNKITLSTNEAMAYLKKKKIVRKIFQLTNKGFYYVAVSRARKHHWGKKAKITIEHSKMNPAITFM